MNFSILGKLSDFQSTAIYLSSIFNVTIQLSYILLVSVILMEFFIVASVWYDAFKSDYIYYTVLLVFFVFLGFNIFLYFYGTENCGCFGTRIKSLPAISMLKVSLLLFLSIYLRNDCQARMITGTTNASY
jgi:hypothetical protein